MNPREVSVTVSLVEGACEIAEDIIGKVESLDNAAYQRLEAAAKRLAQLTIDARKKVK